MFVFVNILNYTVIEIHYDIFIYFYLLKSEVELKRYHLFESFSFARWRCCSSEYFEITFSE